MSPSTPGPWMVDEDPVFVMVRTVGENDYVCECETAADAHLISAAPDLLQALKDWQNYSLTLEERQNKAMAAIAKAEGRG